MGPKFRNSRLNYGNLLGNQAPRCDFMISVQVAVSGYNSTKHLLKHRCIIRRSRPYFGKHHCRFLDWIIASNTALASGFTRIIIGFRQHSQRKRLNLRYALS